MIESGRVAIRRIGCIETSRGRLGGFCVCPLLAISVCLANRFNRKCLRDRYV